MAVSVKEFWEQMKKGMHNTTPHEDYMLDALQQQTVNMGYSITKQGIAGPFSLGMKLYPELSMQQLKDKGFHP